MPPATRSSNESSVDAAIAMEPVFIVAMIGDMSSQLVHQYQTFLYHLCRKFRITHYI